jgi:hypothetical protein
MSARTVRLAAAVVGATALLTPLTSAVPAVAHLAQSRDLRLAGGNVSQSSNWSGYAETGAETSITGTWKVPTVTKSSGTTYSSSWIGIDGFANSDLIQTGTEADWIGGKAHYDAWWEILPAAETVIPSLPVSPGDTITADVHKVSGTTWSITITDTTTGGTFTTTKSYSGPGASAEWIQERPELGSRLANLARYGTVTFTGATVDGANPKLTTADEIIMAKGKKAISTPSVPSTAGDAFSVAYGAAAPPPPAG